jgi:hypothetical protein
LKPRNQEIKKPSKNQERTTPTKNKTPINQTPINQRPRKKDTNKRGTKKPRNQYTFPSKGIPNAHQHTDSPFALPTFTMFIFNLGHLDFQICPSSA